MKRWTTFGPFVLGSDELRLVRCLLRSRLSKSAQRVLAIFSVWRLSVSASMSEGGEVYSMAEMGRDAVGSHRVV